MNTPTLRFGTERPLVQIQSPRQQKKPRGAGTYSRALTDVVEMFGAPYDRAVRR